MRTFPILRHLRSVPPSLLKASPKGEGVHPSQSGTLRLYLQCVNACISDLAEWENLILLGRGGQCLFREAADALHVQIVGSELVRVERLMSVEDLTREEARAAVESRGNFRNRYSACCSGDPSNRRCCTI